MIKLYRGTIIGYLEVLEEDTEKSKEINDNCRYYKCRCKCGNIVSIQAYRLNSFSVKSCGCIVYERRSNEVIIQNENEVVLKASNSEDTFKVSAEAYKYVSKFNWLIDDRNSVKTYIHAVGEVRLTRFLTDSLNSDSRINFKNNNSLDLTYENLHTIVKRNSNDNRNLYFNKRKKTKQWYAYMTSENGRKYLGCFETRDEAVKARDKAESYINGTKFGVGDTLNSYKYITEEIKISKELERKKAEIICEPKDSLGKALEADTECKIASKEVDKYKIPLKSSKKFWWECTKGHRFSRTANYMNSIGYKCSYCNNYTNRSQQEIYLYELFNCNFDETEYSYRDIETRLELDMIIWELGIAIEFNGEYWHRNDTQQYIETKVNIARQLGLKLIIVTAYNNRMDTQISEHDNYIDIQTGITNNTDIDMLFNTILDRI